MKIICAGLSKTGTKSLTKALRTLGYTVYDCFESYSYHIQQWHDIIIKKRTPDFVSMYSDVDAVVDAPCNHFYREIFEAFPDAKVILTMRDSEDVWVKSFVEHGKRYARLRIVRPLWLAVQVSPTYQMVLKTANRVWGMKYNIRPGSVDYEAGLKEIYCEHNEEVKQRIPAGQLLVYNVREGWGPLCDFLNCRQPSSSFPYLNKESEMIKTHFPPFVAHDVGAAVIRETILIFSIVVVFISVLVLWYTTV